MHKVNRHLKFFLALIVLIFMSNFVYSNVEVFSNYDTIVTINSDNFISVNKTLTLKNVYSVGIVPGQIEFKVAKGIDGSLSNIEIQNVSAVDQYGKEIKTRVRNTDKYSVIIVDVYYPLLPGFEYKFNLNYQLGYDPGGIFFKSLQIPLRESTIPIEKGEFKVVLPDNYYFTYLEENTDTKTTVEGNNAIWEIKDNLPNSIVFEYSYLPISIGSFKGSYIFWIVVNIILLSILFIEVKREIKKVKGNDES